MKFYDGSSESSSLLANYNYRSNLVDVVSSGNNMVIQLRTDFSVTHRGFRIVLTSELPGAGTEGL